ncbi:MAG: 2-oxoacid:acceptor oxidoreductase family protein [Chloroflexota bacterium]|nr:2-oxoacid:acceptor oxidoreductase family protein [Chloroflexota bacterium]
MQTAPLEITTYRNLERAKYPFCPGCGHAFVLDHLNAALIKLQIDPRKTVIVTDIGCVGMSDQYFDVNAFHGLHGRAITYATGIKLQNPELTVFVLMGDGGLGIGGAHLLSAARRNIGITVLVFNNLNFGMTGGEHSVTTPHGGVTATTRGGNLERPLDVCATVSVNGASYVYRGTSFDKDLPDRIAEAITTPGFALLDIWELCTAYYVPNNKYSKNELLQTMQTLGLASGVLQRMDHPELSRAYREQNAGAFGKTPLPPEPIDKKYDSALAATTRIVLAGAAGGKVKSTASSLALGAMYSGLWATQRDDYPTTVMSGYSVSEVILSRDEILYMGISKPDILAVITPEGLTQVPRQLRAMDESQTVYVVPELADQIETRARKIVFNFEGVAAGRKSLAVMTTAAIVRHANLYPLAAFREAISAGQRADIAAENLKAVDASERIL